MDKISNALLKDIRAHTGRDGFMLAALEMKYASNSARGDFGNKGLKCALNQLQNQGLIEYEKRQVGFDYFTFIKPTQ